MITGDSTLTAAAIAAEADFLAEVMAEDKLIRREQAGRRLIAVMGGTNDAPMLAQADVAVADTQGHPGRARGGNIVDPRLPSGEAAPGHGDRHGAADDARRVDHRQRRGHVLRSPAGGGRLVMPFRRHQAIECLLAGLLPAGRTLYDFFTVPTAFSPIFPWAASEIRTFGTPVPRACRSRMRHRPDRAKGRSANLIQIGVPVKLLLRWRGKWQVRTMVSSGH
jgi:hypothetical protein